MKNESLMKSKATLALTLSPAEAEEVRAERAIAEPKHPLTNAPEAGTRSEAKATGWFGAWFHAPFIP